MSGNPYDEEYNEDELTEKEFRFLKHTSDKKQKKLDDLKESVGIIGVGG